MTPKAALNTLLSLLLVIALSAGFFAVRAYNAAVEQAARVSGLEDELKQERAAREALTREVVQRAEFDRELRRVRTQITNRIHEVSNEDSPAGDYLRTRIPDGVRDAIRGGPDAVPATVRH